MQEIKQLLIDKLEAMVHQVDSAYTIDVYGSHRTGLCMHWSDIDIVVNSPTENSMYESKEALNRINEMLESERATSSPWITNVDYKKLASVPLVTITCSLGALVKHENLQSLPKNPAYEAIYERSIQVDITCNSVSAHDMMNGHRH